MTEHAWWVHDGAAHCYFCGETVQTETPPEDGCLPLLEKLRKVAENPAQYSRRSLQLLLVQAADRLEAAPPPEP